MSKTANEKKKEIVHVGSYNAMIFLNHQPLESVTIEGINPVETFEKLLRWYLIYRSKYFEGLVYDKVDELVENYVDEGVDLVKEPLALGRFSSTITLGENIEKHLEVVFYKRIIV